MEYYPDKENPWSYIYIRLYGEGIKDAFNAAGFEKGTHVVSFEKYEEIQNLLFLYKAIGASENKDGGKIIANALFLLHKEKNDEEAIRSTQEKQVKMFQKYIDDNYFKNILVSDISKEFNLSKNYIRNLFVKYL